MDLGRISVKFSNSDDNFLRNVVALFTLGSGYTGELVMYFMRFILAVFGIVAALAMITALTSGVPAAVDYMAQGTSETW